MECSICGKESKTNICLVCQMEEEEFAQEEEAMFERTRLNPRTNKEDFETE